LPDLQLDSAKLIQAEVGKLRESFNWIMTFVVGALLIGFLTLLFAVAAIIIDAWRFNSTAYEESMQVKFQAENIKNSIEQQKTILEKMSSIETSISQIKELATNGLIKK